LDGIHDMGGMEGFGAIEMEPDEPTFHEPWQARVFAMNSACIGILKAYNADEYRHAVERMSPTHYLSAHYYERMLTGIATLLVEGGTLTHEQLEAYASGAFRLSGPLASPQQVGRSGVDGRFAIGDTVRVLDWQTPGHTRVPRYVRGKEGIVRHVAPAFPYPDHSAHGLLGRSESTYHVEFTARELWGEQAEEGATVVVDLWDSYLAEAR